MLERRQIPIKKLKSIGVPMLFMPEFQRFQTNCGGPKEDRTPDLLTASQARSQLRHKPIFDLNTLFENVLLYY